MKILNTRPLHINYSQKVEKVIVALKNLEKGKTLLIESEDWIKHSTPMLFLHHDGKKVGINLDEFQYPIRKTPGVGWYFTRISDKYESN